MSGFWSNGPGVQSQGDNAKPQPTDENGSRQYAVWR